MAKILVIQHARVETLGSIADALEGSAHAWQYVRTYENQPVPAKMGGAGGLIVMGGPMGVYEKQQYPHLRDEMHLIEDALNQGAPVLGVCLGSQLLAAVLGAKVGKGEGKEIGWKQVRLAPDAHDDRLWSGVASSFVAYHWHGDVFDLPKDAVLLASSDQTAHQAFRHGHKAYGLLFHLEVTEAIITPMVTSFANEMREAGADEEEIIVGAKQHLARLRQIGETVFGRWAELVNEA